MNFFEHQAQARRVSTRLMLLFGVAVLGMVLGVNVVVVFAIGYSPGTAAFASLATLAVVGLGSLFRIASLRGGGEPVALQMGGVPVPEDTADLNLRRLRNVVEEIAIAAGVPVPKVYVLEHEAAINAFAAGYSPADAVVAVTRGALERLNRDELQGVIAHEFSHILNGDMRLNIRLIGVLFGIMMLALIGRKVLIYGRLGGRNNRGTAAVLMAALVAMLIGYIGLFFGRMIKAGVSRTRERLADASAVQFTRQTAGLAGALKKIGGLHEGSTLTQRGDAEEVSHMLFGDGVGFSGLFATHPKLIERIQALEPNFRAEQLEGLSRQWQSAPPNGLEEDVQLGLAPHPVSALSPGTSEHAVTAPMVVSQVAHPSADDYRRADDIAGHLGEELHRLAARRDTVMPLLLGLLMDGRDEIADKQVFEIAARLGKVAAEQARHLRQQHLADLHPVLRLPLASIAFPVLRLRPRPELELFLDAANAMVYADGKVSLFEYCLSRLLTVQVRESLDPGRYAGFGRSKPHRLKAEIATLLAVVAQAGHAEPAAAQHAYLAGLQRVLPNDHIAYAPPTGGAQALDDVWVPLDALDPLAKQLLVEAITVSISHDGKVNVAEAELLRTICGVLHCPLPPVL
ncbi:M48 family metallopeptidase [Lysobacter sp. D1-1-M9]|uniref:M48 family metallopeptidase n=1 Tax=Novilysobacter longmucuonensis TaxID=3098603 RepID=UPI002FC713D2